MEDVLIKYMDDKDAALSLIWDVFLKFEAPEYSEAGVNEFYKSIHDEDYLRQLCMYGAFLEDKLIGVIAARNANSHIALFFVDGKYHRQGIGRKLFEAAKSSCHSNKMTVNSSPYAVPVYAKLGFCQTDEEQVVNGIRFTPMELCLSETTSRLSFS
ncbi:N-acetyltransferase [Oscillospiraceae bacterium]|nr:N-acetyltransferase [Oscillospiraceae bacterium]